MKEEDAIPGVLLYEGEVNPYIWTKKFKCNECGYKEEMVIPGRNVTDCRFKPCPICIDKLLSKHVGEMRAES